MSSVTQSQQEDQGDNMSSVTNEQRKAELCDRVSSLLDADVEEFAPAKDLKAKGEHQQRRKCSQCNKSYLGQANSSTCGDACRQRKSRG